MHHVAQGRLNKQIAFDMSISVITVKVHRGQVMRKMNARSLPELARMADLRRKPSPGQSACPRLLLEGPDKVDVALVALLKQAWERS